MKNFAKSLGATLGVTASLCIASLMTSLAHAVPAEGINSSVTSSVNSSVCGQALTEETLFLPYLKLFSAGLKDKQRLPRGIYQEEEPELFEEILKTYYEKLKVSPSPS